ncbi:unnamed protein product [Clonostachys rosea f. rosea IK726]|uniref:D-lactate dehydratase n=3 Tax=Bionectria ochroleuca TaxID=29856 RepID=A0A0B7KIA0_BIOOC|nr:unnamed protein product [Clonostachys rosea f. rosea IK726]CAG9953224.1 unnamed protein product [Clonostachys rosea f. rosea IK726]
MVSPRILVVLTSFGYIQSIQRHTGWYLPELAHPYDVLHEKAELVVASPNGGVSPVDPESVESFWSDDVSRNFYENEKYIWENTTALKDFMGHTADFDAIFFPGGHGPMFDLTVNKDATQLIEEFYAAGKVVAAVCHGPAVFSNAFVGAQPLLNGRKVTGFSNVEEELMNLTTAMPFLLEDALKQRFGSYEKAKEPWGEHIVVDGRLITGQNPASAKGVAEEIAKALGI